MNGFFFGLPALQPRAALALAVAQGGFLGRFDFTIHYIIHTGVVVI